MEAWVSFAAAAESTGLTPRAIRYLWGRGRVEIRYAQSPHDPPWMDLEVNTVSLLVYLAWYAHRKPRWRRPPNELRRACKEIPGPIDVSEWQRLLRIAHDEYRRIPLAVLLRLSEDQRRWVAKEYSRLRLLQSVADDARRQPVAPGSP